MELKFVMEV